MSNKPFMVTLVPSADVDLGRWMIQHWEFAYDEHAHAPVFHALALKWYGFGSFDYPLLVDGKNYYPTPDKMVAHFDQFAAPKKRLLPDQTTEKALYDEVMSLQDELRHGLGNGAVHWAYYKLLPHKNLTWAGFTTGIPWYEKFFLTFGYGLIAYLLSKGLGLGEDDSKIALEKVYKGFDRVDALLSDGRQFLAGDRLTFADLSYATAAAPMILARGYGGHLPALEDCPEDIKSVVSELRARPAGQFCQKLYDRYRTPAR